MTCLKQRYWTRRGDAYAWWVFYGGTSIAGAKSLSCRQVEVYDSGMRLRYGPDHTEDNYGCLSHGNLKEMDLHQAELLKAEEFELVWLSVHPCVLDN